jgi:nucleoside-diphosphate-sugar epimerase
LVAGINGFIGASLARCLKARGWRVIGLLRSGRTWDRLAEIAGLELIEIEAYAPEALRRALARVQADVAINLAAAGVAPGSADTTELLHGNALLAMHLVEAAAQRGLGRFLHIGSCAEYAPGQPGTLMTEHWQQEPSSCYGAAKLAATHLARAQAQRLNVSITILRLFGVYGPGEARHRLLPAIISGLLAGKAVDLTGGMQQRDWLYIDDAAEALASAAEATDLGATGSIYNVCTGQAASVHDVGEEARVALNADAKLLRWGAMPYRADEPMWVVGDSSRLRALTGWQPRHTWQEGVRATVHALAPQRARAA